MPIQINGPIRLGQRLAIRVPAAPGRTFRPTVVAFEPPRSMRWREGRMSVFPIFDRSADDLREGCER